MIAHPLERIYKLMFLTFSRVRSPSDASMGISRRDIPEAAILVVACPSHMEKLVSEICPRGVC